MLMVTDQKLQKS